MARKRVLIAQLPPTPCTPEMRQDMVNVADARGVSIAELMREAISLFLTKNDRKSLISESEKFKREDAS